MTIEELRIILSDIKTKTDELSQASTNLDSFIKELQDMVSVDNPLSSSIDIDQIVAIYTPMYVEKLARANTAVGQLGGAL